MILFVALAVAGCSAANKPAPASSTSATTWWYDTSADEADMDIDTLLVHRARMAGLPMTNEILDTLTTRYSEESLRNGMVGETMGGTPCYHHADENGNSEGCYLAWGETM